MTNKWKIDFWQGMDDYMINDHRDKGFDFKVELNPKDIEAVVHWILKQGIEWRWNVGKFHHSQGHCLDFYFKTKADTILFKLVWMSK